MFCDLIILSCYRVTILLYYHLIFWSYHACLLYCHIILSSHYIILSYFYDLIILSYYHTIILLSYHLISSAYHIILSYCFMRLSYYRIITSTSYYLIVISLYIHIASPLLRRVSKICEKQLKNDIFLKKCFKNKMFLGQNTAKPSFLKYFVAKKWFHCSFTISRRGGRRREKLILRKHTVSLYSTQANILELY